MNSIYRIKWGIDFNDNYNYGAKIAYTSSGDVAYSSPLMPPGVSIKSWYSKTEFHSSRKSPMLPMLLPGHEYELTLHAEFDRKEAVQLLVEFFDKDGFFLEKLVFETTQESFRFPHNATDYQIHMVNKKHQQILFKELVLSTKENQALAVVPIGANSGSNSGANIVAVTPLVGESAALSVVFEKQNSYVKEYSLPDCEAGLFIEPGVTAASSFLEVLLEQIYQRIDNPDQLTLKMGQNFSLLESCYHDDFSILALLFAKPNKETESTELMHRLQKKIVLNRRALNVLENLKENRKKST
ncbi:accessory Sec system protein Asp3 [Enterococcus gallinarum]|uniref:accessory Sec system protein Asp3 n=1 Tax=Enterococcus gallinarum TaxID=1353 RepID=UPI0009BD834E|nr:accessory Sec system protein Asp3 [Enterococcus gallinarum]OQO80273.1 accessory Sec system protein Asp3 [Enterococcus gallinarum]